MVAFSQLSVAFAVAASSYATPVTIPHGPLSVFHELKRLPAQWQARGRANKNAIIKAQIGLKQRDVEGLKAKLLDISHPESPNYGNWLSKEEIEAYTAPPKAHVEAVKSWLAAAGITEVTQASSDWIEFTAPVSKMEVLLDTEYQWFFHPDGTSVPRTTKYSIPKQLHSMIDLVTPTTAFYTNTNSHAHKDNSNTLARSESLQKRAACAGDGTVSPACIKSIYNVDYTGNGTQLVATTGLLSIGASISDYALFGNKYVPGLKNFTDVSVSGGVANIGRNSPNGYFEGNIDTQYMGGISHPNPSEYLSVGNATNSTDAFTDQISNLASYLTSTANPPSVVSTSYAGEEQLFDGAYLDRVCNEFMKAGSQGISVFFSSGDLGVGGQASGHNCSDGFYALWPASCPWITSVGGTEFVTSKNTEVVANFSKYNSDVTSPGGGFSWHFSAPDYNKNDTSAYANSLDSSYTGYYNPTGRGYPDLSLVSVKYNLYAGGALTTALGTSASTPAVAALIGTLNDYRKSLGKPKLGFLNPLLYTSQGKTALRDITSGHNFGCGQNGFYAGTGWDPASGLGSLDFGKFRKLL